MTYLILSLVMKYSAIYGVEPALVLSVIDVESDFKIDAVSETQDLGLMQLHLKFFKKYKVEQLKTPDINIRLGIKHLSEVRKSCKYKNDNTFVVCYNLGAKGGNALKYPRRWPYYKKVQKEYIKWKKLFP